MRITRPGISAAMLAVLAAATLNFTGTPSVGKIPVILVVIGFVTIVFYALNSISGPPEPDREVFSEAVRHIRLVCNSRLSFYGTDKPEIEPPVSLGLTPEEGQDFSLDAIVSKAEEIAGSLFIARFAESGHRVTLLLGESGSGKSTLLLRLAVHIANGNMVKRMSGVPLVLGLREWTGSGSWRTWLSEQASTSYGLPTEIIDRWIDQGNTILLLDGLDEVTDHVARDQLTQAIKYWTQSYRSARIVVSCRMSAEHLEGTIRSLHADQLAIIRPLPDFEARQYIHPAASDPMMAMGVNQLGPVRKLARLFEELMPQYERLRSPGVLALVTNAADEALATTGERRPSRHIDDPADPALRRGREFLVQGDYPAAKDAFLEAGHMSNSRHRALSMVLYAACEAVLGDTKSAQIALEESIAARLDESVSPEPRSDPLTADERCVLGVLSSKITYGLSQVGSKAELTPSRTAAALLALTDRGAIETHGDSEEHLRYRLREHLALERQAR